MEDKDWDRLLTQVRARKVVPVVGSRLLVDADGRSTVYPRVAQRLLQAHGVETGERPLPEFRELNEAITRLKDVIDDGDDFDDLYREIHDELARDTGEPLPPPLLQLAEITDFPLVVTLTPDDLLERAFAQQNRRVNVVMHSPRLATKEPTDLEEGWNPAGQAVNLLYLFGKANPLPLMYAIHDEDVLEYAHNIIADGGNVPSRFLDALRARNLLLIGCNFPDWLSRFFLRATRSGPLAEPRRGDKTWLVDRLDREDPFVGFLDKYTAKAAVLSHVDPVRFVGELHERWKAAGGTAAMAPRTAAPPRSAERPMFFISYSRGDSASANALRETLAARLQLAESEIWFDKDEIKVGEPFPERILRAIRSCRYFLPLISRDATERERAYVFREWHEATHLLPEVKPPFLLPLVVDTEYRVDAYNQTSVNAWRGEYKLHFGHAPQGVPDDATLGALQDLVARARSAEGR